MYYGNEPKYIVYCDYILAKTSSGTLQYDLMYERKSIDYNYDGTVYKVDEYGTSDEIFQYSMGSSETWNLGEVKVYGDVRSEDGESAPTDDVYETVEGYDFSQATDDELVDLLNDILEALETNNPDLSSIEGILKAIYYQCCGINNKMITYDQCNALIMQLIQSDNENAQDIVQALLDLREDLKNSDNSGTDSESEDGENTEKHEIAGTLYNVKPLDKNWLNKLTHLGDDDVNLKVEYEGETYYLEDDGTLCYKGKYYYVDMNYEAYSTIDFDFDNDDVDVGVGLAGAYVDVDFNNNVEVNAKLTTGQQKK